MIEGVGAKRHPGASFSICRLGKNSLLRKTTRSKNLFSFFVSAFVKIFRFAEDIHDLIYTSYIFIINLGCMYIGEHNIQQTHVLLLVEGFMGMTGTFTKKQILKSPIMATMAVPMNTLLAD